MYTVEPIFNNTWKSNNRCYNDRSENPHFYLYLSYSIYFCNKEYQHCFPPVIKTTRSEGTKIFHRKKISSILSCLQCYCANEQVMQAFFSLHSFYQYHLGFQIVTRALASHSVWSSKLRVVCKTYASRSQQRFSKTNYLPLSQ